MSPTPFVADVAEAIRRLVPGRVFRILLRPAELRARGFSSGQVRATRATLRHHAQGVARLAAGPEGQVRFAYTTTFGLVLVQFPTEARLPGRAGRQARELSHIVDVATRSDVGHWGGMQASGAEVVVGAQSDSGAWLLSYVAGAAGLTHRSVIDGPLPSSHYAGLARHDERTAVAFVAKDHREGRGSPGKKHVVAFFDCTGANGELLAKLPGESEWDRGQPTAHDSDYQSASLLFGSDGLYFVGFGKEGRDGFIEGWPLPPQGVDFPTEPSFRRTVRTRRRFANFDAGASIHVDASGALRLYSIAKTERGPHGARVLRIQEFAAPNAGPVDDAS